jgi:hypothetical protein
MPVTGTATTEANAQIDAGLNYVAFWSDLSAFADQGEDFKLRKKLPQLVDWRRDETGLFGARLRAGLKSRL